MLPLIALAVAAPVAGVLGYAATRPDTFRTERTTTIAAPPETILPLITDFRRWAEWSPYEKMDPAMKKTYGGAASGTGAVYEWAGNGKAGTGRMEITEVSPSRVAMDLRFEKPFRARNVSEFILRPAGAQTEVTWATHGPQPFVSKVMCIFINMDELIGRDFAVGLATLKAIAESR
jgi:uncharacterized protein YndB with AHSA1/START domain